MNQAFEVRASQTQKIIYTLGVILIDISVLFYVWNEWPLMKARIMFCALIPTTIFLVHFLINNLYKLRIQVDGDTITIKGTTYKASQIDSITMGLKQSVYIIVSGRRVVIIDPLYMNYSKLIRWATNHGIPCEV